MVRYFSSGGHTEGWRKRFLIAAFFEMKVVRYWDSGVSSSGHEWNCKHGPLVRISVIEYHFLGGTNFLVYLNVFGVDI